MLWYVAFIAALNLVLGYVWGAYFRPCQRCAKIRELGAVLSGTATKRDDDRPVAPPDTAPPEPVAVEPAMAESAPATPEPGDAPAETNAPAPVEVVAAEPVQERTPPAEEPVAAVPRDPSTGLVTREHAEQLLAQLAASHNAKDPVTVALVEVDPVDWIGDRQTSVIDERLLCGVSIIVREALASDHTAARFASQQLLLLVPHEDVHQATRRTEELRRRIATTEFLADGRTLQTTVTCALTELSAERSGPKLFEYLEEALCEAKRYGGNRTFMHDGNSPTPIVPPELEVAPQQLAI